MITALLSALFFLLFEKTAFAYFDPGSGGYLIGSILAMVGGFFAVASAFVIHFFRNILGKRLADSWKKHRLVFLAVTVAVSAGACFAVYRAFLEPTAPQFDPSLSGARALNPSRVSPGYNLYEGKLVDMQGRPVRKWSSVYLGTIDKNGDYYAQKYFEAPVWGRYLELIG